MISAAATTYLKRCGWTLVHERPLYMSHTNGSVGKAEVARLIIEQLNRYATAEEKIYI